MILLRVFTRLAQEYQRRDGFGNLPPMPGQIVIPIDDELSDIDEECCSDSDLELTDDSDDEMDENVECNSFEESPLTPRKLFWNFLMW